VSGASSPSLSAPAIRRLASSSCPTRTAEHHALRHACAGDVGDAAHGTGQPAVVELQGHGEVGPCPAVGAVPLGGKDG
jgi:hypothetical protein